MKNFKYYLEQVQSLNEMPIYRGGLDLSREASKRVSAQSIKERIKNFITFTKTAENSYSEPEIKAGQSVFNNPWERDPINIFMDYKNNSFTIQIDHWDSSEYDIDIEDIEQVTNSKYDEKNSIIEDKWDATLIFKLK